MPEPYLFSCNIIVMWYSADFCKRTAVWSNVVNRQRNQTTLTRFLSPAILMQLDCILTTAELTLQWEGVSNKGLSSLLAFSMACELIGITMRAASASLKFQCQRGAPVHTEKGVKRLSKHLYSRDGGGKLAPLVAHSEHFRPTPLDAVWTPANSSSVTNHADQRITVYSRHLH